MNLEIYSRIVEGTIAGKIVSILNVANKHHCSNSQSCREHALVSEVMRLLYAKQMWYYELRSNVMGVRCVYQNESSAMRRAREQCSQGWVVRDSNDGVYVDVFSISELAPIRTLVSEYPEYQSCFFASTDSPVDVFTSDELLFLWDLVREVEALPEKYSTNHKRKKKSR
jgi:hypothetical protein